MQSQQMDPEENSYEGYDPLFTQHSHPEQSHQFARTFGEKLSSHSTKRHIPRLRLRLVIGFISALLLVLLSYSVFDEHDGVIKMLLICVSLVSINIVSNLLIGWRRKQRRIRGLGPRLVLAFLSGIMLVVLSNFMLLGGNGVVGVLIVVVSIGCINVVSYVTAYSKSRH